MTHITRQVILYTDLGTLVPWKNNLNPPYSTFVVGPIQGIGGNLLTWAFNFKGIEFLQQTQISQSLYLCNLIV